MNSLGGPGSSSAGVVWMAKDAGNKMQKGRVVELDGFDFSEIPAQGLLHGYTERLVW